MKSKTDTPEQRKGRFLSAFALTGNISSACKASTVGRSTVYEWQEHDNWFADAFRIAEIESTERLELEAYRRAHDGTTKVKRAYYEGKVVDEIEELNYSDTLLIFLLKARNREKYGDKVKVETEEKTSMAQARKVLRVGSPA